MQGQKRERKEGGKLYTFKKTNKDTETKGKGGRGERSGDEENTKH